MNTANSTLTSRPINPTPTPPGVTSPVSMPMKGTSEPDGVQLSCIEFTEPFDVSVTDAPQTAEDETPARTSLPSMLPPPWSAVIDWFAPTAVSRGLPLVSAKLANSEPAIQMTAMTASTMRPCRLSLTSTPNATASANARSTVR